jgi:hypothetical protein
MSRPSRRDFAVFACLPVAFTLIAISSFISIHAIAGDFHKEFWPAAVRVLHGESPYVFGRYYVDNGLAFPYPATTAVLFAPFGLLSRGVSETIFTVVCFAALFGTLRVLEVRDWRLYGLMLLWAPVVNAWQSANLTPLLAFGVALVWRYRDRPLVAGPLAALAVSLKPFVWPIGIWLLATRRYRAAVYGLVAGLLLNAASFAVIGFHQIDRYLKDASKVSDAFYRHAYTPTALALHFGAGVSVAVAIGVVVAVLVAVACVVLGRRGDQLGALTLSVALMLLSSPVLWMHYFALTLVPLAIARPRLEPVWALPIVLLICGSRSTTAWQIILTLAVITVLIVASLRPRRSPERSDQHAADPVHEQARVPSAA